MPDDIVPLEVLILEGLPAQVEQSTQKIVLPPEARCEPGRISCTHALQALEVARTGHHLRKLRSCSLPTIPTLPHDIRPNLPRSKLECHSNMRLGKLALRSPKLRPDPFPESFRHRNMQRVQSIAFVQRRRSMVYTATCAGKAFLLTACLATYRDMNFRNAKSQRTCAM